MHVYTLYTRVVCASVHTVHVCVHVRMSVNTLRVRACVRVEGHRLTPPGSVPAAFEDMLENPLNSTQWMNDPETGPVMLQISRIFQTMNRT